MSSTLTRVLSALVLLPLMLALIWRAPADIFQFVLAAVLGVAGAELWRMVKPAPVWLAALVIYVALPLATLAGIRNLYGPGVLLIMIGIIVISDSAQYFTGRAFGRRKLAPSISPKKTVEGAVGGLIFGVIAGVWLARVWLPAVPAVAIAGASVAVAVAGMAGDLFESWLKRRVNLKDSGNLIPGHGGILDRIDSWLFAAPVFLLCLKLIA